MIGSARLVKGCTRHCLGLLVRNRLAIAVASLVWLVFRSGSQPRRFGYPCQQVAAFNVGAFLAGLFPALWLFRKNRAQRLVPRSVLIRRQVVIAGCLLLAGFFCVEGYQYANSLREITWPALAGANGDPEFSVVGIAQLDSTQLALPDEAQTRALVRKAVERAGGLESLMTDKPSRDGVNGPDGVIRVVLKPNLVQDSGDATQGVVTHPVVCAEVAKMAFEAGADEVIIAEGAAAGETADRNVTYRAFEKAGYATGLDPGDPSSWTFNNYDTNVKLVDLNDAGGTDNWPPDNCRLVSLPTAALRDDSNPGVFEGYWVPEAVLDADVLICVPTFKNHYNGTVTCSLKNHGVGSMPNDLYHGGSWDQGMHGKFALMHSVSEGFPSTVPPVPSGTAAAIEHQCVHRSIVDVNLACPLDFAVVDGRFGVTNGPNREPVENPDPLMRMIVAGKDTLAVDTACALAMGYDPDPVPHLFMADAMGTLGTMDRRHFSVVGDRIWKVRAFMGEDGGEPADFPEDYAYPYGASVHVETDPPWILSTSVNEGDKIVHEDQITGSGIGDGVGVVRAELGIDVLGPNLAVNGDFETGDATGWTEWTENGGWGHDEAWDYANTEGGQADNYCLRLGNGATVSSFGVFQEVAVEPGKTYRLDAYWKGEKLGDLNWWEVILIDGAFDIDEADYGPLVELNYMFAYDNNTYGLPGGIGTTFGWVWCHNQYAPPKDEVDWNNRRGRRTASGNTMTIVLKAGSNGDVASGVAAWFDAVELREVVSEDVVDHVPDPVSPAILTFDATPFPPGEHPAELRVSVFDAALNEDSIVRNVTVQTCPPIPWVCVDMTDINHTIFVGDTLGDDAFDAWNCGCAVDPVGYTIDDGPAWLSVFPDNGVAAEGAPASVHTVSYAAETLAPGTHNAVITITGDYNERTIAVALTVETVQVDFDEDGDVDMADFGHFQACLSGPGIQAPQECRDADMNGDLDVDQDDFGAFQNCISGPTMPPVPGCSDG